MVYKLLRVFNVVTIKRIEAGRYIVSDGRMILKSGSGWYILTEQGERDFGPVATLTSVKKYVDSGSVFLGDHNFNSNYGRRQSKREYNAYLAAEAKKGNYLPLILTVFTILGFAILMSFLDSR
jgi:hypothetical protein